MTAATATRVAVPSIGTAAGPAREARQGLLQRLRTRRDRRRAWRESLRRERALQHAVAAAPSVGAARETAALFARR